MMGKKGDAKPIDYSYTLFEGFWCYHFASKRDFGVIVDIRNARKVLSEPVLHHKLIHKSSLLFILRAINACPTFEQMHFWIN